MNELDHLTHLREDVPAISMRAQIRGRERLEALMAPANRQRRRPARLRVAVAAGIAVLAVSAALSTPVLLKGEAAGQAPRAGIGSASAPGSPVTIDLAAFSVKTGNDGEVVVTLRRLDDLFNPAALQRALSDAGVSAIVKVGTCRWSNISDGQAVVLASHAPSTFVIKASAIPTKAQIVFDIATPWSHGTAGPSINIPIQNGINGATVAFSQDGHRGVIWWGLTTDPVTC